MDIRSIYDYLIKNGIDVESASLLKDENVDEAAFIEINESDLRELNIKLGPRKKVLVLIAKLKSKRTAALPSVAVNYQSSNQKKLSDVKIKIEESNNEIIKIEESNNDIIKIEESNNDISVVMIEDEDTKICPVLHDNSVNTNIPMTPIHSPIKSTAEEISLGSAEKTPPVPAEMSVNPEPKTIAKTINTCHEGMSSLLSFSEGITASKQKTVAFSNEYDDAKIWHKELGSMYNPNRNLSSILVKTDPGLRILECLQNENLKLDSRQMAGFVEIIVDDLVDMFGLYPTFEHKTNCALAIVRNFKCLAQHEFPNLPEYKNFFHRVRRERKIKLYGKIEHRLTVLRQNSRKKRKLDISDSSEVIYSANKQLKKSGN